MNSQPVFHYANGYFRDDKFSSNYVLQFNKPQYTKANGVKKDIGNQKGDTFNLIVSGLNKVDWGNKVPRGCVARAEIAFAIDQEGTPDVTTDDFLGMCAAWRYFFSS